LDHKNCSDVTRKFTLGTLKTMVIPPHIISNLHFEFYHIKVTSTSYGLSMAIVVSSIEYCIINLFSNAKSYVITSSYNFHEFHHQVFDLPIICPYSCYIGLYCAVSGWLGSRVVCVLDSGAEGPGFKSQPRRCRVA